MNACFVFLENKKTYAKHVLCCCIPFGFKECYLSLQMLGLVDCCLCIALIRAGSLETRYIDIYNVFMCIKALTNRTKIAEIYLLSLTLWNTLIVVDRLGTHVLYCTFIFVDGTL